MENNGSVFDRDEIKKEVIRFIAIFRYLENYDDGNLSISDKYTILTRPGEKFDSFEFNNKTYRIYEDFFEEFYDNFKIGEWLNINIEFAIRNPRFVHAWTSPRSNKLRLVEEWGLVSYNRLRYRYFEKSPNEVTFVFTVNMVDTINNIECFLKESILSKIKHEHSEHELAYLDVTREYNKFKERLALLNDPLFEKYCKTKPRKNLAHTNIKKYMVDFWIWDMRNIKNEKIEVICSILNGKGEIPSICSKKEYLELSSKQKHTKLRSSISCNDEECDKIWVKYDIDQAVEWINRYIEEGLPIYNQFPQE